MAKAKRPAQGSKQSAPKSRVPNTDAEAAWAEVVADLNNLAAAIRENAPPPGRVSVRQVAAPIPPPPEFGPADIRRIRDAVGVSQTVFAELLGASAATVRAWERGGKEPSMMARRLLAEMADDPQRWRDRVAIRSGAETVRAGA